jgi:YfiH family protein
MDAAQVYENKINYIFGDLAGLKVIGAFSARGDKDMSLNCADSLQSLVNRRIFLGNSGIDYRSLVCAKQAHGSRVRQVQEKDKGRGALAYDDAIDDTDAFVTDIKNLPLAVFTADCLPVFFFDSNFECIGLAHAGWRSTKEHIAAKTVNLMRDKFGCLAANIRVGFGPAIRGCCYEVGSGFNAYFKEGLANRQGRYYLDLVELNKNQLLAAGIREENIYDCGICTFCRNRDFFSYRKEGKNCGRMMSIMMLK